jgi:hypothetical protein
MLYGGLGMNGGHGMNAVLHNHLMNPEMSASEK